MAGVKIDLKGSKSAMKQLRKFDRLIFQGSELLRSIILQKWDEAKSPNGIPFKGLSTKPFSIFSDGYAGWKRFSGRKPIRDFNFTGKMVQGFHISKKGFGHRVLKFRIAERNKALGNLKHAPSMLNIGKKLQNKIIDFVRIKYWAGVK